MKLFVLHYQNIVLLSYHPDHAGTSKPASSKLPFLLSCQKFTNSCLIVLLAFFFLVVFVTISTNKKYHVLILDLKNPEIKHDHHKKFCFFLNQLPKFLYAPPLTRKNLYPSFFYKTTAKKMQNIPFQKKHFLLYTRRSWWALTYRGTVHRYVLLLSIILRFILCCSWCCGINYHKGSVDFKIL